jgi:hypothetical protein
MKTILLALTIFIPRLFQTQTANGTVSGRLLTTEGRPAAAIRVAAIPAAEGAQANASEDLISLVETDSNGRFRLENIPPGRYIIMAGSVYLPTFYPGKLQRYDATAVTVRQNAPVSGMDFAIVVPEGVNVRGRVIRPGGPTQIEYANPTARLIRGISRQEAPLNPDGSFEFRDVATGPYTLNILGGPSIEIVVPEKGLLNVDVKAPLMVQLMATMAVEGGGTVPQMSLSFEGPDKTFSLGSSNRGLGFLLPEGEYKMLNPSLPPGYTVKSITLDGIPVTADRIKLAAADRDLQLQIVLANAPGPR